jgi:hypothetical protein
MVNVYQYGVVVLIPECVAGSSEDMESRVCQHDGERGTVRRLIRPGFWVGLPGTVRAREAGKVSCAEVVQVVVPVLGARVRAFCQNKVSVGVATGGQALIVHPIDELTITGGAGWTGIPAAAAVQLYSPLFVSSITFMALVGDNRSSSFGASGGIETLVSRLVIKMDIAPWNILR